MNNKSSNLHENIKADNKNKQIPRVFEDFENEIDKIKKSGGGFAGEFGYYMDFLSIIPRHIRLRRSGTNQRNRQDQ
jgi:hypothetical protein